MQEGAIFRDTSKLSPRFVPDELPHRQAQVQQILHVFSEAAGDPDRFPLTIMQVIGVAGIGKTTTVIRSAKMLEEKFAGNRLALKTAYVNLKLQGGNKFAIYRFLLEKIAPDLPSQGLSAEEIKRGLEKAIERGLREEQPEEEPEEAIEPGRPDLLRCSAPAGCRAADHAGGDPAHLHAARVQPLETRARQWAEERNEPLLLPCRPPS